MHIHNLNIRLLVMLYYFIDRICELLTKETVPFFFGISHSFNYKFVDYHYNSYPLLHHPDIN